MGIHTRIPGSDKEVKIDTTVFILYHVSHTEVQFNYGSEISDHSYSEMRGVKPQEVRLIDWAAELFSLLKNEHLA